MRRSSMFARGVPALFALCSIVVGCSLPPSGKATRTPVVLRTPQEFIDVDGNFVARDSDRDDVFVYRSSWEDFGLLWPTGIIEHPYERTPLDHEYRSVKRSD